MTTASGFQLRKHAPVPPLTAEELQGVRLAELPGDLQGIQAEVAEAHHLRMGYGVELVQQHGGAFPQPHQGKAHGIQRGRAETAEIHGTPGARMGGIRTAGGNVFRVDARSGAVGIETHPTFRAARFRGALTSPRAAGACSSSRRG